MDMLAPRFHVLAADAYGAGKSPPWTSDRAIGLSDEVALIEPVFDRAGRAFTLVGHSYGAAIALIAALKQPDRVDALILYEPTLFAVIDAESPQPNDADGIREVVVDAVLALEAHDSDAAARRFIDYWMGPGTWDYMPVRNKAAIADSMINVGGWRDALFGEPTPLQAFSELDIPVLYMMGEQSPPSSRGVGSLLTRVLPQVEVIEFKGLGHMGPVTHPEIVNETIIHFLEQR
jgi:pimeloyl-ACP methyl ester carboxylesterase